MVTDSHSRVLGITITRNTHSPITQDTKSFATEHHPITSGPSSLQTHLRLLDHQIPTLQHRISTVCSIRRTNKGSMAGSMGVLGAEGCRCTTTNIRIPTNLSICNTIRISNKIIPHTRPMARCWVTIRAIRQGSCLIRHRASHPAISRMGIRQQHAGGRHNRSMNTGRSS
jgi:hypothetical protein